MSLRPWGVVLAGGDGKRLQSLSRSIAGDSRPKQFCVLFGNKSLLARTRGRMEPAISADRMLFAVVRDHERFYRPELADVEESRIVVQPCNRGTTAAMVYSLLRLKQLERDPVVAFFPSDHHFSDETRFARALDRAFQIVQGYPSLLVLLGATADRAECEYGWIEPGQPLEPSGAHALSEFHVDRFWEKPSSWLAEMLLRRRCLWNTFVVVGRVQTFLEIVELTLPETLDMLRPIGIRGGREQEARRAVALYESIPGSDFSQDVLARCAARLAVLRMENSGWSDLGTPRRALAAMQETASSACATASDGFARLMAAYKQQLDGLHARDTEDAVF